MLEKNEPKEVKESKELPEPKELLSQRIEKEIEMLIKSGKIPVGGRLPTEQEFCKQFSVSRNAIRPALKSLSARGLVTIVKGSGVYVSEFNKKSITDPINLFLEMSRTDDLMLHAIQMRQMVEPEVASAAAMRRTDAQLEKIEMNLAQMADCPVYNLDEELEIDRQFHSLVSEASGNPIVNLLMEPFYNLFTNNKLPVFAKTTEMNTQGEKNVLMEYHTAIFQAIKIKDSREAYFVMRAHLKHTESNYLKSFKEKHTA